MEIDKYIIDNRLKILRNTITKGTVNTIKFLRNFIGDVIFFEELSKISQVYSPPIITAYQYNTPNMVKYISSLNLQDELSRQLRGEVDIKDIRQKFMKSIGIDTKLPSIKCLFMEYPLINTWIPNLDVIYNSQCIDNDVMKYLIVLGLDPYKVKIHEDTNHEIMESYINNPEIIKLWRMDLSNKASKIYMHIITHSDGYFSCGKNPEITTLVDIEQYNKLCEQITRFFKITKCLPLEIQMIISNICGEGFPTETIILSKEISIFYIAEFFLTLR